LSPVVLSSSSSSPPPLPAASAVAELVWCVLLPASPLVDVASGSVDPFASVGPFDAAADASVAEDDDGEGAGGAFGAGSGWPACVAPERMNFSHFAVAVQIVGRSTHSSSMPAEVTPTSCPFLSKRGPPLSPKHVETLERSCPSTISAFRPCPSWVW
jgi:hypothetical protein